MLKSRKRVQQVTTYKYPANWKSICSSTYRLNSRCVVNPLRRADCIHHLKYKRSMLRRMLGFLILGHTYEQSVSGYEIPGWDVVSVSSHNHQNGYGRSKNPNSVHYTKIWVQLGGLHSRNTFLFAWKLRLSFWILVLFS